MNEFVRNVGSLLGSLLTLLIGPFILSAIVVFPLAGIAYVVERVSAKKSGSTSGFLGRKTILRAWIGLAVVLLIVAVIGYVFLSLH